ncbi:uncharacterized protein [Physcomitrium patens]|uniref:uncharacterized protein isoform X2 n=1 Tax=Physcomitrium patens TaxID=3218 RepID=UPI003CCE33F4
MQHLSPLPRRDKRRTSHPWLWHWQNGWHLQSYGRTSRTERDGCGVGDDRPVDGRIKIFGGAGVEAFFQSSTRVPCKFLKFTSGGQLVHINAENDVEVWDLEKQTLGCSLRWESKITAFTEIPGTQFMLIHPSFFLKPSICCSVSSSQDRDYKLIVLVDAPVLNCKEKEYNYRIFLKHS